MKSKMIKFLLYILPVLCMAIFSFAPENAFADEPKSEEESVCSLESYKKEYLEENSCWYCQVTLILTNSFLYAASKIMPIVQTLAKQILKYGFLIWLAWFILKQVSSLAPLTVGKVLQEIAVMAFKVWLATLIVTNGIPFLSHFILTPVISTAVDIGNALLRGIASNYLNAELVLPYVNTVMLG